MTARTREELTAELREYGFDEQADLIEKYTANDPDEPELSDRQQLHQSIQQIATSKQPREVGSVRDVLLGRQSTETDEENDQ